jgi:hypothetical protein
MIVSFSFMRPFSVGPTNWVILLGRTMKNAKVVSIHVLLKCQVSIVAILLALSFCNVLFIVSDSNCRSHMQNYTSHIKYVYSYTTRSKSRI